MAKQSEEQAWSTDEKRHGDLIDVLRELGDLLALTPGEVQRIRIDRAGRTYRFPTVERWRVRVERTATIERWPAGTIGHCPVCGGKGGEGGSEFDDWTACDACGGTGHERAWPRRSTLQTAADVLERETARREHGGA